MQEVRAKDAMETKELSFLANKTLTRFASFARHSIPVSDSDSQTELYREDAEEASTSRTLSAGFFAGLCRRRLGFRRGLALWSGLGFGSGLDFRQRFGAGGRRGRGRRGGFVNTRQFNHPAARALDSNGRYLVALAVDLHLRFATRSGGG